MSATTSHEILCISLIASLGHDLRKQADNLGSAVKLSLLISFLNFHKPSYSMSSNFLALLTQNLTQHWYECKNLRGGFIFFE